MGDWNPRANDIFLKAIEITSPEERDRYLAQACGDEALLRAAVESLLDAGNRAGSFLESPAAGIEGAVTAEQPPQIVQMQPGAVVERYKLLQLIGEGGFGVVFMAEQTHPVQRRVALKIIKAGMDTRQVIARFEAERQAIALMDHPNIARVLDAGTTDEGRPYFVMELVKGVPITKYCDEHHLTPRQRLELFIPVCQAIQHAHQKGIIHRDLKPSNVLVAMYDGRPVPKVIDFGVAKATGGRLTDRTMFTGFGAMVGTLEYMSPEQAELNQLDIDTRSDIYSLGVLLYELLTGTTPLEGKRLKEAAFVEILRVIREEEPPKPSTRLTSSASLPSIASNRGLDPRKLSGLVRGELDWIVMKALEKDRNRRYETANGFAKDIERYLHDEAVQACPPSAPYRFRKFARRNKVALMTTGVVVAALVLGTAISTWQAVRAMRAERVAAAQAESAKKQAAKANASLSLLQEMLGSAQVHSGKGTGYTVWQLLDDFSSTLPQRLKGQPELEATVRGTIGSAYQSLGMPKQARAHLQAALELWRHTSGEESKPVAYVLIGLAWVSSDEGDLAGAVALVNDALRIHRSRQSDVRSILHAMHALQHFLLQQNKPVESVQVGNEALAMARAAGESENSRAAIIMQRLASAKLHQGQFAEAEKLAQESLDLNRKVQGADYPHTGWSLFVLGDALAKQDRSSEALPCFQEALRIFRKHYPHDGKYVTMVLTRLKKLETAEAPEEKKNGR